MRTVLLASLATMALSPAAFGQARVIITEIMYNPASNESKSEAEWVEIANVGNEPIEIKDWRLDDEDKKDWGKFTCTLAPGGVAVLINADAVKEEQFRAAWDEQIEPGESAAKVNHQVIAVPWGGIANSPNAENEVLRLVDAEGSAVCEVKQEGEWPECTKPDGPSIWLADIAATNLSDGKLWRRATAGEGGARSNRKNEIFDGADLGSPGIVPGLSPNGAAAPVPPQKPKDNTIDY
jgi:hypothetical protein